MCVAHFLDIFTSIIPYGTFKDFVNISPLYCKITVGGNALQVMYSDYFLK